MEKRIAVLGATGSVGQQTLDVARARGYKVDFISAGHNSALAERIVREFRPSAVAMADVRAANELKFRLRDSSVKVLSGESGIWLVTCIWLPVAWGMQWPGLCLGAF